MRRPKLYVEPLSDARWSKIERGVFERLDAGEAGADAADHVRPVARARRAYVAYAVVAVAAAMLALLGRSWLGPSLASSPSSRSPSRIVTGPSESHLVYGESTFDIAHDSALVLSGDDEHGVLVVLDRGSVTSEVAPRHGRPPMAVQAGEVLVRVIGTRFRVTRVDEGAVVAVDHGVVAVTSHGSTVSVNAGETWQAPAPPVGSAVAVEPAAPMLAPVEQGPRHGAAVADGRDGRVVSRTGEHAAARALKPPPPPPPSPPREEGNAGSSAAPVPSAPPSDVLHGASPEPAGVAAASLQQQFESASAVESTDAARALATYRELARGSGPWAANGLFAEGRLQAQLGRQGDAARALREYLARFPQGPNAQDARALLDRLP